MQRQLQIKNGLACGEWSGSGGFPVPPDDTWIFVEVTNRPDAKCGDTYDAETDTFTPAPVPQKTRVSKSQVISVLTPEEWHTATTSADPDVQWGMAQFHAADRIDLADPRFAQVFALLMAKNVITVERSTQIQQALAALAT